MSPIRDVTGAPQRLGGPRALSLQLQILRELQRDSRSLLYPLLNRLLVLPQYVDGPGCPRKRATKHIHEYVSLPMLEFAAL